MSKSNKQVLPPGLWVVATPIGNLADLSARARDALADADAIICEDTRETSKLLSALGVVRPEGGLIRLDAHASEGKLQAMAERLRAGESFALVTDAGTPAISDPGSRLVALAREQGVRVTPVPGPSALMALLSVCGFVDTAFVFRGFFPRKEREREEELALVSRSKVARVSVWFESPHRIVDALELVAKNFPEVEGVVAKELTKIHEWIIGGKPADLLIQLREELTRAGERGEWCFALRFDVVASGQGEAGHDEAGEPGWEKALRCLLACRVSASEAARQVCQHFGMSKKQIYERALIISGKKL